MVESPFLSACQLSKPCCLGALAIRTSDQMDSVRKLIAASLGTWEVRFENLSACIDRRNETVGDAATAHVRDKCVDGSLPFRLRHAIRNALVGDNARIALRQ